MTAMLEVSPLSPVRAWARSRSLGISDLDEMDRRPRELARNQHGLDGDDLARGPGRAAAAGGAVGVERLHLVGEPGRLGERGRAADHAYPHLVRIRMSAAGLRAMQGVDPDQVEAELAGLD